MFKNNLNMNLQYFAEPGNGGGGEPKPTEIPEKYNDLVNGIVKKSNSKYLKQIDGLNDKVTNLSSQLEDIKTKNMSGSEKNSYQVKKLQDELNKSKEDNKSLQAQITKGQLTTKVMGMAKEDGLSIDKDQLALIVAEDEDSTVKKYDAFKSFAQSQEDVMKKKFGSVPNNSTHSSGSGNNDLNTQAKQLADSVGTNKYSLHDIQ